MDKKLIITSSIDKFIRIWQINGTLLGNININHHLPILWNIKVNKSKEIENKL